jgi:class 3 adenylate cyclase
MTQERTFSDEERRLVTILFADLVGYTSVSEARDPELIQEALNLCFQRFSSEIERFGGYVDKVVGDEIMALFGAPRAQEDDAGKAVAAALAMQDALRELTPELQERLGQGFSMRIGINTGLVVTGAVGPGGYTVTGDAVNVAARLEAATEPGSVLVGEATRRLARRQFLWGDRQEFTVRNRIEPVVCCAAEGLGEAPLRLVPTPSETPFVGRGEHLDQIRRRPPRGARARFSLWGRPASERLDCWRISSPWWDHRRNTFSTPAPIRRRAPSVRSCSFCPRCGRTCQRASRNGLRLSRGHTKATRRPRSSRIGWSRAWRA